jgi:hypothetical protein
MIQLHLWNKTRDCLSVFKIYEQESVAFKHLECVIRQRFMGSFVFVMD